MADTVCVCFARGLLQPKLYWNQNDFVQIGKMFQPNGGWGSHVKGWWNQGGLCSNRAAIMAFTYRVRVCMGSWGVGVGPIFQGVSWSDCMAPWGTTSFGGTCMGSGASVLCISPAMLHKTLAAFSDVFRGVSYVGVPYVGVPYVLCVCVCVCVVCFFIPSISSPNKRQREGFLLPR